MDKRYQVFVSSTFDDLTEERKYIIQSLLDAKYIPAGMEMFSASNDEQFEYIKKIIDTCDYYVLIIGGRYGTINPNTGISFTEQEYDYAFSKNIPILAFLHRSPHDLPASKRDDDKRKSLETFRAKVSRNRLCKMWDNINNLATSVIISLMDETSKNPQLGWTRGSSSELELDNEKLLKEIQTHIATIDELKLDNERLHKETQGLMANISQLYKINNETARFRKTIAPRVKTKDDLLKMLSNSTWRKNNNLEHIIFKDESKFFNNHAGHPVWTENSYILNKNIDEMMLIWSVDGYKSSCQFRNNFTEFVELSDSEELIWYLIALKPFTPSWGI